MNSEPSNMTRCAWVGADALSCSYHDNEWGKPEHSEHRLFEMLTLEGAQAGLSWQTILRKREGYRTAFEGFDPARVANFDEQRIEELVQQPAIVRHRGKIESTVNNAQCILQLHEAGTSLDEITWSAVGGVPLINKWDSLAEVPSQTNLSIALSKQLKAAGFRFVGPTTVYAYMQACGAVNDHQTDCFCYPRHTEAT